jgi:Fe-S cluster assembly iron-binding protein IscA
MLQISDAAIALLKTTLDAKGDRDAVFRLTDEAGSIGMRRVSAPAEGDIVYEQGGAPVFAAPPDLAKEMDDQVIDVQETAQGPQLVIFKL